MIWEPYVGLTKGYSPSLPQIYTSLISNYSNKLFNRKPSINPLYPDTGAFKFH